MKSSRLVKGLLRGMSIGLDPFAKREESLESGSEGESYTELDDPCLHPRGCISLFFVKGDGIDDKLKGHMKGGDKCKDAGKSKERGISAILHVCTMDI